MSSHAKLPLGTLLVFLVVAVIAAVPAQGINCSALDTSGAKSIYVVLELIDITEINGVLEQYSVDFFLSWYWTDATIPPHTGYNGKGIDPATLTQNFDVEFLNDAGLFAVYDKRRVFNSAPAILNDVTLANSGMSFVPLSAELGLGTSVRWIMMNSRWQGSIRSRMHLADFPFDRQVIRLRVTNTQFPVQEIQLYPLSIYPYVPTDLHITEWTRLRERTQQKVENFHIFDQCYSVIEYDVTVERQPQYYIDKIIVGIVFLVLQAQLMFAFDPSDPNRALGSMATYAGIINYLFVVAGDVPKISQTTRLDSFIQFSFGINFANFLMHCVIYLYNWWLIKNEELEAVVSGSFDAEELEMKDQVSESTKGRSSLGRELTTMESMVYYSGHRHMPSARLVDMVIFVTLNILFIIGVVAILVG